MSDWRKKLSLQYITSEFKDIDEDICKDLTEIHFIAVMDCHDGGYNIEVMVFGRKTEGENFPVVHVRLPASCGIMEDENLLPDGSVSPEAVTRLFDYDFTELAAKKGVRIIWNPGMQTQAVITGSSSSVPLHPQNT